MTTTAADVWSVPAYLPYLQPPPTDAAIAAFEQTTGFTLPVEYLDLLRARNGGYLRASLPDIPNEMIAGIGPHFPCLDSIDRESCQEGLDFSLDGLVSFDGDGH